MKLLYLTMFMLIGLALMPISYAHLELQNETCSVGDNFTIIPDTNLTIAVESNSTVSFLIQSILTGDCSMYDVSITTDCTWCIFSENQYTQGHGSNKAINTLVFVPPLHPNLTNTTYAFTIRFNESLAPENVNFSRNITSRIFGLSVFVPYTAQFSNLTINETLIGNLTVQEILNLISNMTAEQQVQLALVLNSVFDDLNFSFVIKQKETEIKNVPLISPIPLNVEEYQKWVRSCVPDVYEQAKAQAAEAELKYQEAQLRVTDLHTELSKEREQNDQCSDKLFQVQQKQNETISLALNEADANVDGAWNTALMIALISIVGSTIITFRSRYGFPYRKTKPKIPVKSSMEQLAETDDEEEEKPLLRMPKLRKDAPPIQVKQIRKSNSDSELEKLERFLNGD